MQKINGVSVSDSQKAVYDVIKQYEPVADHALVPLAQHQLGVHLSSSGIRTRRAELAAMGLVQPFGSVRTGSGRKAATFMVA